MNQSWIGVLDCNNFFVSCERLFRPDLVGRPVIVLSSNDGCVVARSQEVKDIGIMMGVPYFQIKDIIKKEGITTFSSHFALYRDISRRVFAVMRDELGLVEQYSIDEAFFQIESEPEAVAKRVKQAVEQRVGMPVSVGISTSKTLAKYANSVAKKGTGVYLLTPEAWEVQSKTVPIGTIWGVGGQLEKRYRAHQITTVAEFLQADSSRVAQLFGVAGVRLRSELLGQPVLQFHQKTAPQKSIMSSRSFRETTTAVGVLSDAVAYHVRHAVADLRAMGQKTTHIRVAIYPSRHGDFVLRGGSKEVLLTVPTDDTFTVLRAAQALLLELYEAGVPYKKAGIVLSALSAAGAEQGVLFGSSADTSTQTLMPIIDALNTKSGRELIQLGSRLQTTRWQSRQEAQSPAYTTRWKDIVTVSATR